MNAGMWYHTEMLSSHEKNTTRTRKVRFCNRQGDVTDVQRTVLSVVCGAQIEAGIRKAGQWVLTLASKKCFVLLYGRLTTDNSSFNKFITK